MGPVYRWVYRRRITFAVAVFLLSWYLVQLRVDLVYGREVSAWWFYYQESLGWGAPGAYLSPIAHEMDWVYHIIGDLTILCGAGGLIEPYLRDGDAALSEYTILFLAIGVSFYTGFIVNSLPGQVLFAGASSGILALWMYSSLMYVSGLFWAQSPGSQSLLDGIEDEIGILLAVMLPIFVLLDISAGVNVGHLLGACIGLVWWVVDTQLLPYIG